MTPAQTTATPAEVDGVRRTAALSGRLWIASELYFPEETSTGYVMTTLAEALAAYYPVSVLCGQPTYSARGTRAPSFELRRSVEIRRCGGLTLNKDILPFRVANMLTLTASVFLHALRRFRRRDIVIVVTNPPALPFVILAACRLRGARCVLLIHDVYPEALVASGLLRSGGIAARALARANTLLYRSVSRICVIGRDMAALVRSKLRPDGSDRVTVIPNWSADEVLSSRLTGINPMLRDANLESKFVVQYAGNMGMVHDLECLVEAATRLRDIDPDVHFLFIGAGVKKAWLTEQVLRARLTNVTIVPPKPRSEEPTFLRACDLSVMSLVPGMAGVGVPSRLYNVLAAGKPVIAAVDDESEPARVVREEQIGWVVRPGDAAGIVDAICDARANPLALSEMGRRAQAASRTRYTLQHVVGPYRALIDSVWRD